MKVTLDINVFLDVFQKREPHYAASAQVVSMVAAETLAGVCPAHGLTTLYYLVRKHASRPEAEAAMQWRQWPRRRHRLSSSRGMWRTLPVRPCPRSRPRIS